MDYLVVDAVGVFLLLGLLLLLLLALQFIVGLSQSSEPLPLEFLELLEPLPDLLLLDDSLD